MKSISIFIVAGLCFLANAQEEKDFIKVNVGGGELDGVGFLEDEAYFYAGTTVESASFEDVNAPVVPTTWGEVYRTHRYAIGGVLNYRFPVPDGSYSVGLMFVEQFEGAAVTGGRIFDLFINDVPLDRGIDVWTLAGEKLYEPYFLEKYDVPSVDGYISISLVPVVENPMLSGIVIEGLDAATILWSTTAPTNTPEAVAASMPMTLTPQPGVDATAILPGPPAAPGGDIEATLVIEDKPSRSGTWRNEEYTSGLPIPRHEACAVLADGLVYNIGGRGMKPVSVYDPLTGIWVQKAGPPVEINHIQCVYFGNRIYIGGSWFGEFPFEKEHSVTWAYDIPSDSWVTLKGLAAGRRRGGGAFVLYKEKLYLSHGTVGGHGPHANATGYLDMYDPVRDEWTALADGPYPRDHTTGAVVNDKLCVLGGRNGGTRDFWNANIGPVVCYGFETKTWEVRASLPVPRGGTMAGTTCEGLIMVAGGEGKTEENQVGQAFDRVDFYDDATNSFLEPTFMTSRRHGSGLAITSCECGNIFVPSGSAGLGGGPEVSTTDTWSIDGVDRRCI